MARLWPIPVLLLSVMAWAIADADSGLLQWWAHRRSLEQSTQRIDAWRSEATTLAAQIADLEDDVFASERAIREELGFTRRGEILIRMPAEVDGEITAPLRLEARSWSDGVAP